VECWIFINLELLRRNLTNVIYLTSKNLTYVSCSWVVVECWIFINLALLRRHLTNVIYLTSYLCVVALLDIYKF